MQRVRSAICAHRVPDIEPDEARAVETAIGAAKASAVSAVLNANRDAAEKLHTTAVENGAAFTSSAASITEQVSAKLPETEQSIRSAGEAVVTLIDKMAKTQIHTGDVIALGDTTIAVEIAGVPAVP